MTRLADCLLFSSRQVSICINRAKLLSIWIEGVKVAEILKEDIRSAITYLWEDCYNFDFYRIDFVAKVTIRPKNT